MPSVVFDVQSLPHFDSLTLADRDTSNALPISTITDVDIYGLILSDGV